MQLNKREFSRQIRTILEARIRMIWVGIRDEWEPKVRDALLPAADECLARVEREIDWRSDPPITPEALARLQGDLPRAFRDIAKERTAACAQALKQAISWQMEELSQTLTLGGLTGDMPDLERIRPRGRSIPAHLSGGRALAGPVRGQCAAFIKEVLGHLGQAQIHAQGRDELMPALEQAADAWRGHLRTTARTTLYTAAAIAQAFVFEASRH
jgi:plasmid stabilization system protein ParE